MSTIMYNKAQNFSLLKETYKVPDLLLGMLKEMGATWQIGDTVIRLKTDKHTKDYEFNTLVSNTVHTPSPMHIVGVNTFVSSFINEANGTRGYDVIKQTILLWNKGQNFSLLEDTFKIPKAVTQKLIDNGVTIHVGERMIELRQGKEIQRFTMDRIVSSIVKKPLQGEIESINWFVSTFISFMKITPKQDNDRELQETVKALTLRLKKTKKNEPVMLDKQELQLLLKGLLEAQQKLEKALTNQK